MDGPQRGRPSEAGLGVERTPDPMVAVRPETVFTESTEAPRPPTRLAPAPYDDAARIPIERYFTTPGVHPYDEVEWEIRTASITGEDGVPVFEQKDVEVPAFWSQTATNVVVSKYFRGPLGTPQRERSVRQLIDRVVDTLTEWGRKDGYFADDEQAQAFAAELTHLLLYQKAAFNSQVWFNVGVEAKSQCSACIILSFH